LKPSARMTSGDTPPGAAPRPAPPPPPPPPPAPPSGPFVNGEADGGAGGYPDDDPPAPALPPGALPAGEAAESGPPLLVNSMLGRCVELLPARRCANGEASVDVALPSACTCSARKALF